MSETDLPSCLSVFLSDAVMTGCVWGLASAEGWAQSASNRYAQTGVMPFWSQPEMAQRHCTEEWSEYRPVAIALEEFLDDWLVGMHKDALLVGLNWDDALDGEESEPLDVLYALETALKTLDTSPKP